MAEETRTASAADQDNDVDGCDVPITEATLDEDLPEAEGGVASWRTP